MAAVFFLATVLYGMILSVGSVVLGELSTSRYPQVRNMLLLVAAGILENLGFRQLLALWRAQAFWDLLRGRKHWGVMVRLGFGRPASESQSRRPRLTRTGNYRTLGIGHQMSRAASTARTRKLQTGRVRMYRFDARLNRDQKLLIQRAADLEGRSMTDFVLQSAQAAAERTIQEHGILVLSARDSLTIAKAILNPREPGPVLRKAVRQYSAATARK